MRQVNDLFPEYTIKQSNSFVNMAEQFPKLIKFDYLGKYSLKGTTHLCVEVGLEISADYTYFNPGYTWRNTKQKYYITNFGSYRHNLVPATDESFAAKLYELEINASGLVNIEQIRHEIVYFFLPYLNKLSNLDDLLAFMHWHKPTNEQLHHAYRHHAFFYNWLTVIYLLLKEKRYQEAELGIDKIIYIAYSLDQSNPHWHFGESLFIHINKLQMDFGLSRTYHHDEQQRRIIF